ncbi:uncharacterized protein Dyak_GE10397, isoform C [Drosophila yakuba]|nr:uncharacterized protein Dyak_GE10397, isoform C [Drosophila yakuba]
MWRKASRLVRETTSWKTRRQGQAEALSAAVATTKPSTRRSTSTARGLPISIITWSQLAVVAVVAVLLQCHVCQAAGRAPPEPYYGRYIGDFTNFAHGIKGQIYAVDESTLFVKSFAYDGTGPDAFFWVGKTPRPSPEGYIIPYPEEYTGM